MPLHWPAKGPLENNKDYDLDWSGGLNPGDSVGSSNWSVIGSPTSITINSNSFQGSLTKVFVSGGTPGQVYTFQNAIMTTLGEGPFFRTATLLIKADM